MGQSKPFTSNASSRKQLFFIGRDSHGSWVVRDQTGHLGGLFVDRAQAIHFAMFENKACAEAVVLVPGVLELDFGTVLSATGHPKRMKSRPTARPVDRLRAA